MRVYVDINEHDLPDHLWGQGRKNYDYLMEMGASAESIYNAILELECEGDEEKAVEDVQINDLIWHDFDMVKDYIGLVDWDDMPEVDLESGINTLIERFHDSDIDEDERKNNTELLNIANDLDVELDKCRSEKEISDKLTDLIERAEDLDEDGLFDFEELKEFIEKVE